MTKYMQSAAVAAARMLGAVALSLLAGAGAAEAADYEVWLSDQANTQGFSGATPTGTHGGVVVIHQGADLDGAVPADWPLLLDATADLFPDANTTTGSHVVRLHGILPSPDHRYMALNFVASGHLGIVDGESKTAVCLFRSTLSSTGRQNHMSFWTPDGESVIVSNQNGRLIERVDVSRSADGAVTGFTFNAAATLDLVGGAGRILAQPMAVDSDPADGISCAVAGRVADGQPATTPNGVAKQAPGLRPLNTVICPIPASNGRHVFATLGGGGLFVVDVDATPMAITGEYDTSVVRGSGCGGVEAAGFMHLNSGTPGAGISEFTLYRFALGYPAAPGFNAPNQPAPVAVWQDPDNGKVAGVNLPAGRNRDAHGIVLVRNVVSGAPRYIHQLDRIRNNVEVFKVAPPWDDLAKRHEGRYSLTTTGVCGTTPGASTSNDPTPDLGDLSVAGAPDGGKIFVALRGPFPLSVAHAAQGSCPGLGIITLSPNRKSGALTGVLPTTVPSFDGSINLSDPHAAVVRVKAN
jgi:hypothetical protein